MPHARPVDTPAFELLYHGLRHATDSISRQSCPCPTFLANWDFNSSVGFKSAVGLVFRVRARGTGTGKKTGANGQNKKKRVPSSCQISPLVPPSRPGLPSVATAVPDNEDSPRHPLHYCASSSP